MYFLHVCRRDKAESKAKKLLCFSIDIQKPGSMIIAPSIANDFLPTLQHFWGRTILVTNITE